MIGFVAALHVGDTWTYEATLRYISKTEGELLVDRERWTLTIEKERAFTAKRIFLGTVIGEDFVPSPASEKPEIAKGEVGPDGTLRIKSAWSDPAAAKALSRLLNPDKVWKRPVGGMPGVSTAEWTIPNQRPPQSELDADLSVRVQLTAAKLGSFSFSTSRTVSGSSQGI